MLMMFNSTDLKNSNNSLYLHRNGDRVEQWYTVRDIGAALGDTVFLAPRKNNVEAFESSPFITGVGDGGQVDFAYKGIYRKFVEDRIAVADVEWASQQLAQLSDGQWHDAFRAGGYQPDEARRFIAKLKEKIDEGRGLSRRAARQ